MILPIAAKNRAFMDEIKAYKGRKTRSIQKVAKKTRDPGEEEAPWTTMIKP